ncbi:MAG: AI-2E family transporter [Polyangiaceae bacterium]
MADRSLDPQTDPAHVRAREARSHYAPAEAVALGTLAALAAFAILWVLLPVGLGVLLGTVLAFTTHPAYRRLARRTRRPALVALGVTSATTMVVAGTLGVLTYLLVMQGVAAVEGLPKSFASGGVAAKLLQRLLAPLEVFHVQPAAMTERLGGAIGSAAADVAGWAAQIASTLFDGLLAMFFMVVTMFFVLQSWSRLGKQAERLMPINPHHTRRLMREIRRLGQSVVIGNFGTAVVQGIVGWVGYAIAHVPQAALLGAVTAVASLVPVFGTMLVWLPAGVLLTLGGHPEGGVFVLVWGTLAVIGLCDYVVRPKLVGRGEAMSTWMMFVALFGGIRIFGFVGVLLGPMLVGVALAALELYARTRRFRLAL